MHIFQLSLDRFRFFTQWGGQPLTRGDHGPPWPPCGYAPATEALFGHLISTTNSQPHEQTNLNEELGRKEDYFNLYVSYHKQVHHMKLKQK